MRCVKKISHAHFPVLPIFPSYVVEVPLADERVIERLVRVLLVHIHRGKISAQSKF